MKFILFLPICVALWGCNYGVHPPQPRKFTLLELNQSREVYQMKPTCVKGIIDRCEKKRGLNLLFVAADEVIQHRFTATKKTVDEDLAGHRIEQLVWWQYFPHLSDIYHTVVRLPYDKVSYQNFSEAVFYLEGLKKPYDIVLLTHGIPNHLSDGKLGYFLSFRELEHWQGQLSFLNLVLMQGCFSRTLSPDWIRAGAKYVVGYDDLHQNFFYLDFFLRWYRLPQYSIEKIVRKRVTLDYQKKRMQQSRLYRTLIKLIGFESVDDYISRIELPQLDTIGEKEELLPAL